MWGHGDGRKNATPPASHYVPGSSRAVGDHELYGVRENISDEVGEPAQGLSHMHTSCVCPGLGEWILPGRVVLLSFLFQLIKLDTELINF